eukprot:CAMPEP_0201503706 /NCGR_PEP_ID=MMETSP0151_2-20130828/84812_1 /ASSEMBLY_ACC=CAM_ASM_000257 /TAXON_ID=200890 /ORGANISM="Paramoeba atlantica, Strain 621/1 / CCAP 1560/9" /LENGTH=48 /DNA_ID= /DNA_START= /DNA_END= /DNA_ORIENTATION=
MFELLAKMNLGRLLFQNSEFEMEWKNNSQKEDVNDPTQNARRKQVGLN